MKPEKAKASSEVTERFLKFLALVGAVVSLFGYGVVLGVSSAINLDHGSMLGGPFELLTLVWPGVLMLVAAFDKIDLWAIVADSSGKALPVAAMAFLAVVFVSVLQRNKDRLPTFGRDWVKSQVIPEGNESIRATLRKAATLAAWCLAIAVSAPVAGLAGIFALMLCLLMIPFIGYGAGQGYFAEYVLKPQHCVPVVTGSDRRKGEKTGKGETGATCASVTSPDPVKPYANHGRVVLSSSSYMLIYHMDTGEGERIPVAGLVIRSVDDEGIAKLEKEAAKKAVGNKN